jgi:hypothetical protein
VGQFPVAKKIAETQRARRSAEGSNKMGCSSAILCALCVYLLFKTTIYPKTVETVTRFLYIRDVKNFLLKGLS